MIKLDVLNKKFKDCILKVDNLLNSINLKTNNTIYNKNWVEQIEPLQKDAIWERWPIKANIRKISK